MVELIVISVIVLDLVIAFWMLYIESVEQYGCFRTPDMSDIYLYVVFGLFIVPFFVMRQICKFIVKLRRRR